MGLLLLCSMVAKNSARGSIHDTVRPMTSPWSWHRFLLDWSSHASFSIRTCVVTPCACAAGGRVIGFVCQSVRSLSAI